MLNELGDLALEVEVDRKDEAGAGLGGDLGEGLDFPAGGVDLDVLAAGLATQDGLVDRFDAHLPDAVVHLVSLRLEAGVLLVRDLADVAEDEGDERAHSVLPNGLDDDLDAGQAALKLAQGEGFFWGQPFLDDDGREGVVAVAFLVDFLEDVGGRDFEERFQLS